MSKYTLGYHPLDFFILSYINRKSSFEYHSNILAIFLFQISQQMSLNNSLDLSIQLEENQQKSKQQELEEFVELTKKIAESDRNNDLLRQIKKNKMNQVHKVRALHRNVLDENETLQAEFNSLVESIKQTKNTQKGKNDYYEQLSKRYDELTFKQKQVEEKHVLLNKENQNFQKKILSLQRQYEEIIKGNKQKTTHLQKLQKKKELQDELINESRRKISQLQQLCQTTKLKAIELQQELKHKSQNTRALQILVADKERQIQQFRREKEESQKKQQQNKRITNKLVTKIKAVEQEIDKKGEQYSRLEGIHRRLEKQIQKLQKSQDLFEQLLLKRREMVKQLRKDSSKLFKQRQTNKDFRSN